MPREGWDGRREGEVKSTSFKSPFWKQIENLENRLDRKQDDEDDNEQGEVKDQWKREEERANGTAAGAR